MALLRKDRLWGALVLAICLATGPTGLGCLEDLAQAEAPLYTGLDPCFSVAATQVAPFVPYTVTMSGPSSYPPFAESFEIRNALGTIVPNDSSAPWIREIFLSKHFISLPSGAEINTQVQASQWSYPVGTEFVHELDLESGKLFEIRLLKRMSDHWAFGVYEPAPLQSGCAGKLQLRTDEESASEIERTIHLSQSSRGALTISYKPIRSESCLSCHQMGPEEHDPLAGPCHFQNDPNTPYIQTDLKSWEATFTREFGYSPLK